MHPDRVGLRSALLVIAGLVGVASGALMGYGCSQDTQQHERLPVASAHLTPRVQLAPQPPESVSQPEGAQANFEPRPAVPSGEPDLRVRIAALRGANAAPRLTHPSGSLTLITVDGSTRTVRTPVEIRVNDRGFSVCEGVGSKTERTLRVNGRKPIEFRPPVGARAVVTFEGVDWPGPVRAVPVTDVHSAMDLVVDVPLERYLPGVLARELFKSWSPETFRAQAIAARSFAVCEHAHWSALRHYDLVAGEASQAWAGDVKDARPRQAVADTRGMLLVYEDRVVPAYYSSTCGGTPANAVDSLTRNPYCDITPLLAGADDSNAHRDCCRAAPRFRWEQTMSVARVLSQVRRWAGDQLAAEQGSTARADAGSRASASARTNARTGESTDTALAPALIDAPIAAASLGEPVGSVTVTEGPAGSAAASPAQDTSAAEPVAAVDEVASDAPLAQLVQVFGLQSLEVLAANQAGRPIRVRLVDARGTVLDMRAEDFRRAVNYAREGEPTPKDRLNSSAFHAEVVGANIRFKGAGFGHGVGMCQFGAESMAQKGASAQQILRTYYPGATTRRAY